MAKSSKAKTALYQGSVLNTCAKNTGPECRAYENLANAIVEKAVRDWQDAYLDIYYGRRVDKAKCKKHECESFFKGEWIKMLTKIDGRYLLSLAERQVKEYDYQRFWYNPRNTHLA